MNSSPNLVLSVIDWVLQSILFYQISGTCFLWYEDQSNQVFGEVLAIMTKKRQRERIQEISQDLLEFHASKQLENGFKAKENDELFTVDRTGSIGRRRKINKIQELKEEGKYIVSKTERKLIEKISKKTSVAISDNDKNRKLIDLWGEEGNSIVVANRKSSRVHSVPTVKKSNKLVPAIPGQSYNPSSEQHQEAILKAYETTFKKEQEDIKNKIIHNQIHNNHIVDEVANTLIRDGNNSLLISNHSDNSDSSDNSDDGDENNESDIKRNKLSRKQRTKLTQAQRNKARERKKAQFEQNKALLAKKMMKTLNHLPSIVKELEKLEKSKKALKEEINRRKEQTIFEEQQKLSYEEAGNIPLSDELNGSLRKLKPKGSLLVGQVSKMVNSGDVLPKDRRKRRNKEKPHGAKRVVWTPKYKYS